MSHRTAATALLLASLPYGIALPQVVPLVNGLAPFVTPRPLPFIPALNASTVTVIGTIVQPAIESAVQDVADAVEDATETNASALESITNTIENALSTDVPSNLDPEANILPLILPGILPVETDLPPIDAPDVVPTDLPIPDLSIDNGTLPEDDLPDTNNLEVIDLPAPNVTSPADGLPDTNDLEEIDLPVPSEIPKGNNSLIAKPILHVPDFPDFPDEASVPLSTFNAVVQPLMTVIQTLLNALPGNFAPPSPGIFIHPLLPTETPEIFIDPILPTETPDVFIDPLLPTETPSTNAADPLFDPLVDPIPTLAESVATDLPFVKREAPADLDADSIFALIAPILEAISALIARISGPAVADIVSDIADAIPELPDLSVPAVPIDAPVVPIPDITLPGLLLPSLSVPDVLLTSLPVSVPDVVAPELPVPELPSILPALPVAPADLTSGIPDEVLNAPFPDDIEGIDWAAFESPPFSDLPAPSLDDLPIPDDILNIPWPDLDENGFPIDLPVDPVEGPAALPTNLNFLDIPVPDDFEDLDDFPAPPALPIDTPLDVASDVVAAAPVPLPTDLNFLDIPVPDDFEDLDDFPAPPALPIDTPLDVASDVVAVAPVPLPTSLSVPGDLPITDDLPDWPFTDIPETLVPDVNGELPDLDELQISGDPSAPVGLPTDSISGLLLPNPLPSLLLPTDLVNLPLPTGLLDVPVPEDFEDLDDLPAPTDVATAIPAVPTIGNLEDIPIPDDILNIPWPDLDENGFPIDLPVDPVDGPAALPTNLNFLDIPVPDDFEDLDDFPAPPAPTAVLPDALPDLPIPDDILNIPIPDFDESGVPVDLPAPALPNEDFGAGFPIQALPDVPLVLPVVSDVVSALPTDDLLPVEGPAALTEALSPVATDALSGLPTENPADVPPAVPTAVILPTDALSNSAPELPVVPAPSVPAPALTVVSAVPVVSTVPAVVPAVVVPATSAIPAVVPSLPFQVPSVRGPLGKRQLPNLLAKTTSPAVKPPVSANRINDIVVGLVRPLLNLIIALLDQLPSLADKATDPGATSPAIPIVPTIPAVPVASILPAKPLTFPTVPDVSGLFPAVSDVASILPAVPDVASALPTEPDVASILPAVPAVASILPATPLTFPTVPDVSGLFPAVSDVASILPAVPDVASALPAVPDVASILPAVPDVASAFPAEPAVASILPAEPIVASILPATPLTLPTVPDADLPLARRTTEELQQGPASDWESFLGELDDSYQSELAGLVHDSAKAVNNDDLDTLAESLKSDYEGLSDNTKSMLATTFGKRMMRHGKRQAIPGAQSIGPNLDDAPKADFSGILGKDGSLDPFGQASQSQIAPGQFVDDLPAGFRVPGQAVDSFAELADSSVASGMSDPELSAILEAGGLDPNNMLNPSAPIGSSVDDAVEQDPYADIRKAWDPALQPYKSAQALEGLDATIQASKNNHIGSKVPRLPFVPALQGGSATAAQAQATAQQQGNVLDWFHRYVKPSWNKNVDAEIVR